nr:multicopper oxidase abr1 [Quercus suber]
MLVRLVRAVGAVALCMCGNAIAADVHTLDWNISWVTANPDGLADRPTMAINGEWPLPLLNFTMGDRMIVNLYNGVRVHTYPTDRSTMLTCCNSLVTRARVCISMVCFKTEQTKWMDLSGLPNATFLLDLRLHTTLRSTNPEHTGTTHTRAANIPTVSGGSISFTIRTTPTTACSTKKLR